MPASEKQRATDLRQSARASASYHGHKLTRFKPVPTLIDTWDAACEICGAEVRVTLHPKPNEIDIGGEAVAIGCIWPNNIRPN